MLEMARVNVEKVLMLFMQEAANRQMMQNKREDYIDYLNKEISRAAAKMMAHEANVKAQKILDLILI